MGLSDVAYWMSYFISDGIILGALLSLIGAILSAGGGLFNEASFGVVWGFLFIFCLSGVPFAFFICSFFDTPQTSGQATLALLLGELYSFLSSSFLLIIHVHRSGFYITYMVLFMSDLSTISFIRTEVVCCLVPPLALQIGSGAFLRGYKHKDGLSLSQICGIMVSKDEWQLSFQPGT